MNSLELKAARARKGLSQKNISEQTSMTEPKYCNKENGKEPFLLPDVIELIPVLDLSLESVNIIFFDGGLPIGKIGDSST